MDMEKIMQGVAASWDLVRSAKCNCGGRYGFVGQSLIYSEDDKCMADVMEMVCLSCNETKKFTIPQHHMKGSK